MKAQALGVSICLGVTVLLQVAAGRADDKRFVPTIGTDLGSTGERLRVTFDSIQQHEDRQLLNTRFFLGLGIKMPKAGPLALRSEGSIGFGLVYHTGHGLLEIREAVVAEYDLGAGFAIPFGLGLGLSVDTTTPARSALQIGLPLGLRYRSVELWYRPAYVVPLDTEERGVFTGTREQYARPGFMVFDLSFRVRLGFLGF